MLDQIAFSTQFRYEYIDIKGDSSFSTGGFTTSVTIPHNLGYVPYYKSYVLLSGDTHYYYLSTSNPNLAYGESNQMSTESYYADSINLYCTFVNFTPGTLSGTFYYRIYAEPQS